MHIIRTAEALASALDSPLDPELIQLLRNHADQLADYPDFAFEELAEFVVVEAGDTLDGIRSITGPSIIADGADGFTFSVELIVQHPQWIEATFILSDDGFGLILLIELADKTDPTLLTLCARELQHYGAAALQLPGQC